MTNIISKIEATVEETNWAIDQYSTLQTLIKSGRWNYSSNQLEKDFQQYKFLSWCVAYKWVYLLIILVIIFTIILIWAFVLLAIYQFYCKSGFVNYKKATDLLKLHELVDESISPADDSNIYQTQSLTNDIDAISKLFELMNAGALTQEEFEIQKKNILQKNSPNKNIYTSSKLSESKKVETLSDSKILDLQIEIDPFLKELASLGYELTNCQFETENTFWEFTYTNNKSKCAFATVKEVEEFLGSLKS